MIAKGPAHETRRPDPDRPDGTIWRTWELGAVVDLVDAGASLEDVARRLSRSLGGVQAILEKLMRGEARPPIEYTQRLERLQAARKHAPQAVADSPANKAGEPMDERVAREIERLAPMVHALLACQLIGGCLSVEEIRRAIGTAECQAVLAVAHAIVSERCWRVVIVLGGAAEIGAGLDVIA